jgi:hypothetical protein
VIYLTCHGNPQKGMPQKQGSLCPWCRFNEWWAAQSHDLRSALSYSVRPVWPVLVSFCLHSLHPGASWRGIQLWKKVREFFHPLIQGRLGVGIAKGPFCLCGALRVLGGDLNPIRLGLHSSPGWGVSSCLFLSSASLKLAPVVLLVLVPRKGVPLATWSCSTLSRHPRDCGGFHVDYLIQTGWMGQGRGIWS